MWRVSNAFADVTSAPDVREGIGLGSPLRNDLCLPPEQLQRFALCSRSEFATTGDDVLVMTHDGTLG